MAKVTVVGREYINDPRVGGFVASALHVRLTRMRNQTVTSETEVKTEHDYHLDEPSGRKKKTTGKDLKSRAKHDIDRAEAEGEHIWGIAKEQLLRPGVAGGLLGVGTCIQSSHFIIH